MLKEILKNNASSTLAAAITSTTATTLTVTSAASFPTTGNFRILIDSELMLVTGVSGTTFTVTRGVEGTTAATHGNTSAVTHILTSGALQAYGRQNDPYFESNRPAYGLQDVNGNVLTAASFTGVNMGSSTVTDQNGTILANVPSTAGESVVFLSRAYTSPRTVIGCLRGNFFANGTSPFLRMGLGFRNSTSGQLMTSMYEYSSSYYGMYQLLKYTSPTVYNTSAVARTLWHPGDEFWFKIKDDGTNLVFYISHDGINWLQTFSEARTTFMTSGPDSVGWFVENDSTGASNLLATLTHWDES